MVEPTVPDIDALYASFLNGWSLITRMWAGLPQDLFSTKTPNLMAMNAKYGQGFQGVKRHISVQIQLKTRIRTVFGIQ